jgi:glycerol-3-phosphate dehydrogenase
LRRVTERCVINATGPWAEQFAASSVRLRLTKGVNIVIDRAKAWTSRTPW